MMLDIISSDVEADILRTSPLSDGVGHNVHRCGADIRDKTALRWCGVNVLRCGTDIRDKSALRSRPGLRGLLVM